MSDSPKSLKLFFNGAECIDNMVQVCVGFELDGKRDEESHIVAVYKTGPKQKRLNASEIAYGLFFHLNFILAVDSIEYPKDKSFTIATGQETVTVSRPDVEYPDDLGLRSTIGATSDAVTLAGHLSMERYTGPNTLHSVGYAVFCMYDPVGYPGIFVIPEELFSSIDMFFEYFDMAKTTKRHELGKRTLGDIGPLVTLARATHKKLWGPSPKGIYKG